ncbi:MAG: YneF family protein [Bacilli bacterium]|jgi:uncharacterized protein YneF (UPF0154 family)
MLRIFVDLAPIALVGWIVLALVAGAVAGFFIGRKIIMKQLEKNPPINEQMIRAMFMSMGRKPSEAQIRAVMNSIKNSNR